MSEADLTAWLNSPETRMLAVYLRRRKAETVQTFLLGQPVDPVKQGRAAALHELEQLLASPAANVQMTFEVAIREQRTK